MIIGITGGIGTGKSTVLKILKKEYDFKVYESDKVAHELMQTGYPVYESVVSEFGKDILDEFLNIDRKKLGAIVFNDKEKLLKINALTHPVVIAEIDKRIDMEMKNGHKDFVIESALLLETDLAEICDKIWYIYSSEEIRIKRLIEGRNMTREKVAHIMKNQWNEERYKEMCDAVIDNSGDIDDTRTQIDKILNGFV